MESYPRVIVGTDGSPDATAAVRIGAFIAKQLAVPLEVITSYEDDSNGPDDKGHDWAVRITDDAAALAREIGATDVTTRPAKGDADDILIAASTTNPDALIAVGSAGLAKATSRLVGSTSNKLAHHSLADVLYAREPAPKVWNFVALATDGSDTAVKAVRRGLALAVGIDATPRLVTAAKNVADGERTLAETAEQVQGDAPGVEIEREVFEDPQAGSALIAKAWKYELVVMGNRGMSGASRLLGSVANKVTHGIETNLLLVNTTRV
ncbi:MULTISPECIES: universal stress protein [Antrihabitans]|uniref:Universal stress protein n=2 Tax=Antrihabitans TaxID=2799491 RepID=A0A934NSR7_9NOCA|nr:universal stress protein [Antrihabitans stalagmiti]MBJ8340505.1 universal stress protein [Antrihabitans stalagmiti]